ncbi:MAG: S53 family peptidase [Deinococcales bacterium]
MNKKGAPEASTTPQGYSPQQIRTAYGFSGLTATGSGTTIAIVDAYDDPNAEADLATFASTYGFPACDLTKVDQNGGTHYPRTDQGWTLEISLDVQWACAVAPGAHILLVEAKNSSFSNLLTAVATAAGYGGDSVAGYGPTVAVSMSWGGSEFSSEGSYDAAFQTSGVTFTASSGDSGTGVIYPAASPYVVGVGGTTLPLDSSGNVINGGETAWNGSGGGISVYEPEPTYQGSMTNADSADAGGSLPASGRGVPDVAYDADPSTGFAVYDSTGYQGVSGWFVVGGTSAGSPQWAALFALADQGRSPSLSGTFTSGSDVLSPTYSLAVSDYGANFTDIASGDNCSSSTSSGPGNGHGHGSKGGSSGTSGSTTVCQTTAGYDFVTGLGSPLAASLVTALAKAQ